MKNSFKKGVVSIVVTMLVVIPNMRVYSIVGNYQTSSPAITANNEYAKDSYKKGDPPIWFEVTFIGVMVGFLIALSVASVIATFTAQDDQENGGIAPSNTNQMFDEQYDKHNFAQFDRYTPSSMKPEGFVNTLKNKR